MGGDLQHRHYKGVTSYQGNVALVYILVYQVPGIQ